jgi:hypothetical protein
MGFTRWQWYCNKTQYTTIHISHEMKHRTQTERNRQNSATIKDTLHTMDTVQRKSEAISVTGPPLWSSGQSSWL